MSDEYETVAYEARDVDGDEVQIVWIRDGRAVLRIRETASMDTLGVILSHKMMEEIVATLMIPITMRHIQPQNWRDVQ